MSVAVEPCSAASMRAVDCFCKRDTKLTEKEEKQEGKLRMTSYALARELNLIPIPKFPRVNQAS